MQELKMNKTALPAAGKQWSNRSEAFAHYIPINMHTAL